MTGEGPFNTRPDSGGLPTHPASGSLFPVDPRLILGKNKGSKGYIQLEARTQNITGGEFRCYTNAVWLAITCK